MYKIIDADGKVIGSTEKPLFIRKKESTGCYVNTDEKQAQGVAYRGTAYNLQGRDGVGAEQTVLLVEFDAGTDLAETSAALDQIIITMLEG